MKVIGNKLVAKAAEKGYLFKRRFIKAIFKFDPVAETQFDVLRVRVNQSAICIPLKGNTEVEICKQDGDTIVCINGIMTALPNCKNRESLDTYRKNLDMVVMELMDVINWDHVIEFENMETHQILPAEMLAGSDVIHDREFIDWALSRDYIVMASVAACTSQCEDIRRTCAEWLIHHGIVNCI